MEAAEPPPTGLTTRFQGFLDVPVAVATFLTGAVALGVAVVGSLAVITAFGWTPFESIVAAVESSAMLVVGWSALFLGLMAVVVGFSTYRRMPTKRSREQAISGAVLGIQALVLAAVGFGFRYLGEPDLFAKSFLNFPSLEGYGGAFVQAAGNTLLLAFVGEAGGIVLGIGLALLASSKRRVVRAPARVYINFFRGTPLIWQLSIFYFGLVLGFGLDLTIEIGDFELRRTFVTAMLVFILNTAAYAAEVFRAGIQSIERGQLEAARSLGMSYMQAMRHAVIPQAFRRVIPPLMNEFVILIKDTSLVIVLGLSSQNYELFTLAREGYANTFNATFFVAAAGAYLAVTLPLIRAVNWLERKLRSGLVGVGA